MPPTDQLVYKRSKIVLRSDADPPELYIDDKRVPLKASHGKKSFTSLWVPFRSFPTLMDLAKEIIDRAIRIKPQ